MIHLMYIKVESREAAVGAMSGSQWHMNQSVEDKEAR